MELWQLRQRQSLPLEVKIQMSLLKIRQWYEAWEGNVYVSFSGGKDSTVLLHLVRSLYPHVPAVFVDTGLEYPEIRQFVKHIPNVISIKPNMNFKDVLIKYGYPAIDKKTARMLSDLQNPKKENEASRNLYLTGIKRDGTKSKHFKLAERWKYLIHSPYKFSNKCCYFMKHEPIEKFEKRNKLKAYVGVMATDGRQRESSYIQTGCNNFKKRGNSTPLGFWTEQDIWDYLRIFEVPYCSIYDKGEKRTGCMFCMFGCHLEQEPNRFQRMERTHTHNYIAIV